MSKKKIKIASSYKENDGKEPLLTVVEFCLERGSKLSAQWPSGPFHTDAAGTSRCTIIGDTTLKDVLNAFEFPDHFIIGTTNGETIWDEAHHTKIIFTSFETHEELKAISTERKAKSDALLAAALKKRALKNGN